MEIHDSTGLRGTPDMLRTSETVGRTLIVLSYIALSSLPFVYALGRLQSVTGQNPIEALVQFPHAYGAIDALQFLSLIHI